MHNAHATIFIYYYVQSIIAFIIISVKKHIARFSIRFGASERLSDAITYWNCEDKHKHQKQAASSSVTCRTQSRTHSNIQMEPAVPASCHNSSIQKFIKKEKGKTSKDEKSRSNHKEEINRRFFPIFKSVEEITMNTNLRESIQKYLLLTPSTLLPLFTMCKISFLNGFY